jgi:hypothetical protein
MAPMCSTFGRGSNMGMLGPMRVAAASSNVMVAHIIILFIFSAGNSLEEVV